MKLVTESCKMAESALTLPKRGSKACQHCGCLNGNRAYACKSCHRPLKEHAQQLLKPKRSSVDVSQLLPDDVLLKPDQVFSVRVRQRGPDYRTFVSVSGGKHWQCHYAPCKTAQEARLRSSAPFESHAGYIAKQWKLRTHSNGVLQQNS